MGTNFYAKIKMQPRNREKVQNYLNEMQRALNENDVVRFSNTMDDLVFDWGEIKSDVEIHLGKRSAGWAFLWDLNNMKYYKPELTSIVSFLKDSGAIIENEYEETFTIEEFLNEEVGEAMHPSDTPMTKKQVEESDMSETVKEYIITNYINKDIPYYRYCTSETYAKMNSEHIRAEWCDTTNFKEKCKEYAKNEIKHGDTDFVSKDNLRFSLYTDFS